MSELTELTAKNLMQILDDTEVGKDVQRNLIETWFPWIGTDESVSGSETVSRLNEWWEAVGGEFEEASDDDDYDDD